MGIIVNNILKLCMVLDGYDEIYQDDRLLSYIISNQWGIHLKLIYCMSILIKNKK